MTGLLAFDSACSFVGKARDANLARAKQLGAVTISCYIVGSPGGCPHTVAADIVAIHAHGMGATANWERAADFFRTASAAQCTAAGDEAGQAMKAVGFPAGSACAFSWDYDVAAGDYATHAVKARTLATALSRHGYRFTVYGEKGLIAYFIDRGIIPAGVKGWLSMSEGFGSFAGGWDRYVALVQQHTAAGDWLDTPMPGCDVNTILDPSALGAWWPDDSPFGEAMPTADEIADAVWKHQLRNVDANGVALGAPHPASMYLTHANQYAAAAVAGVKASAGGNVDVSALATAIAAELGPDIAKSLGEALVKGSAQ